APGDGFADGNVRAEELDLVVIGAAAHGGEDERGLGAGRARGALFEAGWGRRAGQVERHARGVEAVFPDDALPADVERGGVAGDEAALGEPGSIADLDDVRAAADAFFAEAEAED